MTPLMLMLAATTLPSGPAPSRPVESYSFRQVQGERKVTPETPRARCKPHFRRMSGSARPAESGDAAPCYQLAARPLHFFL